MTRQQALQDKEIVIAFVPVLHSGYLKFFRKHAGSKFYMLAPDLYSELEQLTREIRALELNDAVRVITSLGIFSQVGVIDAGQISRLDHQTAIVMPNEDICRIVKDKFLPEHNVTFESVFLRYDLPAVFRQNPVIADNKVLLTYLDRQMMSVARSIADRSPDWWRQVGAVLVQDQHIVGVAYNKHMPSQHSLYTLGDPRNNFLPGEHLEISSAHHAEKVLISRAAADGVSTAGASLYVSTFPCPSCAYDIATCGIAKVYYEQGYSSLEAQETLKSRGVEIIRVIDA